MDSNVVKELVKLQVAARELVRAVDDLEGVEIPYQTARLLAATYEAAGGNVRGRHLRGCGPHNVQG